MNIFFKRYVLKRKLPGIFLFNGQNEYALHFHGEQIPDENNKMYLDGEKLVIDYNLNEIDVESVISAHEHLDLYLRKNNIGELKYWYPKDELKNIIKANSKDGIHQSGTTRISNSIEDGVVDKNLEVFGIRGLYVCSSSVFPTSSQANPTFMLGAFAIRLAKYLSNEKN
jgi:choline dehydrogenase-like flavoprotein